MSRVEGALAIGAPGIDVEVLPYGGHLVTVEVPDRDGRTANVVVALDRAEDYREPARNPHLGSVVGRYANRIGGARFVLDGVEHRLVANEGPNTLHGGPTGWSRRDWTVDAHTDTEVRLSLLSPDGDGGFPGNVSATVRYAVSAHTLEMEATATTDRPTVVSMTQHAYWNLAGEGTVDDHLLDVSSDEVLEVDRQLVPTGRRRKVPRLGGPVGVWDTCFVLSSGNPAAHLEDMVSGRRLTVRTDQPSLQVYTGEGLGAPFGPRAGVCLEPQGFPNAPNRPGFPSTVLRPGETYRWRTRWEFGRA